MKKCVVCKEPVEVEGHETCGKVECVGPWAMYPEEYAPVKENQVKKRIIYNGRSGRVYFRKKITIEVVGTVEELKYKIEDFGPELGPSFIRDVGPADSFYRGAEVEYDVREIERQVAYEIVPFIEKLLGWRQKVEANGKLSFGENSLIGFPKRFENAEYQEAMRKLNEEK